MHTVGRKTINIDKKDGSAVALDHLITLVNYD